MEIDDTRKATLSAIHLKICDAIDEYNDAVIAENDELAQIIHLSIQGLRRQQEFWLKRTSQGRSE